ncbi:MAG: putative DNA binding domain-containing protein [Bacteroidota bacterium]|nr:putative DNA binding domain-containing protein [Bacteroidota bacterium]
MNELTNNKKLEDVLQLGEGQYFEFKESLDKSFAKEMVAFTNASGGYIYLGITDRGTIKGISVTNNLKSKIQDVARNCDPAISVLLSEYNNVLIVDVKEGINKPYSCSAGFFLRMGANSQKMKRNEILSLAVKSGKIRYDEQICNNFDWKDFDNEKFEYYLKLAGISNNLSKEEILKNLRVLTNDGLTNAGVLFFAKKPYKYIISSKVRCIHFHGDKRIDILDKKLIDSGIIGNIEFAIEYLRERVPVRYEIKDIKRKEFPEYPIAAYREAIVNAIIHFDYFLGDTIAIEKLKSSIIINNKGELLFPESEFGKKSEARNRLLVDLLTRTNLMERAGTGIKRVRQACDDNNNKVSFTFSDSFWITIETNIKKNVLLNAPLNAPLNVPLNKRMDMIIKLVNDNKNITIEEMAAKCAVNDKTIKRDIEILKNNNILKRFGSKKTGYWKIVGE